MVTFLIVVCIAILCFSHFQVFCYGQDRAERILYHRHYRPLLRRHARVVDSFIKGIVDDGATAQQKNVKLLAVNAVLRGKAIGYLLAYREATRYRRRKSKFDQLARFVTGMAHVAIQLDQTRRATARK